MEIRPSPFRERDANAKTSTVMIASKDSFEPHSRDQLPASQRVYLPGVLHPDIRVPMRSISLSPTKSLNGLMEANESVRVYDCSGPWGDPDFDGTVERQPNICCTCDGCPPRLQRLRVLVGDDCTSADNERGFGSLGYGVTGHPDRHYVFHWPIP